MATEQFKVQNVKCGGCANNIKEGLGSMNGVTRVEVTIESGQVIVEGANLSRPAISQKLSSLGYPEC